MILTGPGVSSNKRSFVVLEIVDEDRAFEVARRIAESTGRDVTVRDATRRIAESTGRDVTVRDANWVELTTIPGGKRH